MASTPILIAGAVTRERTPTGDHPGGPVYHAARALGLLPGVSTTAVTAMGSQESWLRASFGRARLVARSADSTATFGQRRNRRGTVRWLEECAPSVDPLAPIGAAAWILAPAIGEMDLLAWARCAPADTFVSLNASGTLRTTHRGRQGPVLRAAWKPPAQLLHRLGSCFLSDRDAHHRPGLVDLLRRNVPLVVLTRGLQGATAFVGGEAFHVPAPSGGGADRPGAADALHAVTVARLAQGAPLQEALEAGLRAAPAPLRRAQTPSFHAFG